jgi:uncharacterized membrane protein YdbT with pleckstrin-like domain
MATPAPAGTSSVPESELWTGYSSQWTHFWYYLLCVLLGIGCLVAAAFTGGLAAIGLVVPLVMWAARWWVTKTTRYELTSQRLRKSSGIFTRVVDELELFRVKDYSMEQPFFLRMVGLGNLKLVTSDATTPIVTIEAIPQVESVREKLRNAVQAERDRKRVRQLDVDETGDDHPA